MGDTGNVWNRNVVNPVNPITDQSSVYFIHSSDHSTSQIVSVKFNGTGFANWKRSMLLSLSVKNKLGFVDGSVTKPAANSPDAKAWERCNDMICAWLLSNLDETIAQSVLYFKNAAEIWSDLEERFGSPSLAQMYAIEQQLTDLNQGSKTVSQFFTEMRTLWDALSDADPLPACECGKCTCHVTEKVQTQQQKHRIIQFMMKLGDKFSTIRGNVLMQQPLPKLPAVFRLFEQEEKHQEIAHLGTNTESLACLADNTKQTYASRLMSGNKNSGTSSNAKKNSRYFCTHCKIPGHSIERCFKINGYPPGFKGFKDKKVAAVACGGSDESNGQSPQFTMAQYNQLLSMLNQTPGNTNQDGTNHHALLADFIRYRSVESDEFITIPNGKHVAINTSAKITFCNAPFVSAF
nr:PREDICTED: uncharacterized protein LOC108207464 [Daucus carota subsp. sativus]